MFARWLLVVLVVAVVFAAARASAAPGAADAADKGKSKTPTGAVVVAGSEAARPHARALARRIYADPMLRPTIDEATATVLAGGAAPEPPDPRAAELAEMAQVTSSLEASDEAVSRRLLTSLAADLAVALVVVVKIDAAGPVAKVLRARDGRFVAVTLAAKPAAEGTQPDATSGDGAAWDWSDAVGILRGLTSGPPPGPRKAAKPKRSAPRRKKPVPKKPPDDGEEGIDLLTSPWFWGGIGLVVTVGVTVLVLSQTTLNDPQTVTLEGRVAP
jgi:hypothetical protein